jgi:general secretion pathway protein C
MQKQFNPSQPSLWWLRGATFSVAALAAASAAVWSLKLSAPVSAPQASTAVTPSLETTGAQAWVRLLGGPKNGVAPTSDAVATDVSSTRFKLMGVVAGLSRQGHALIATDGKAAKPYRVGEPVEDGLLLKSVSPRSAELARALEAPAGITLELPKLVP